VSTEREETLNQQAAHSERRHLLKLSIKVRMALRPKSALIALASVAVGWSICLGQTTSGPLPGQALPSPPTSAQPAPGNISGTVLDQSGALVAGARVKLTRAGTAAGAGQSAGERAGKDQSVNEALSGSDGQFSFANIAPGPFQLTVTSAGFAMQTFSGILGAGENYIVPQIALPVAANVTDVEVGLPQVEVAEEQMKIEEHQRVLGVLPNFYVSYVPNAAPLTSKQKFKLAWKTVTDPFTLVFVAGGAGVEQAQNHFAEYGQGAQGYGKRFGAGYADAVAGTFVGSAIFPSLLKQDPRYFYKGTGSKRSRMLYAIANALICKGDNGRWQANYSNILGSLAAGGISNIYYPAQDRDGAELTFENATIGIGATAVSNLFQEFLIRRLTPKVPGKTSTVSQP
jgi:hypothetical protein